jgi:hypothetical protein
MTESGLPSKQACVHKVEAIWLVEPFFFEVFDDEFHVRRYPVRLDGADIIADYVCSWEFPVVGVNAVGFKRN